MHAEAPHFVKPRDYNINPFIVIWEVTRACALKCLHCRAEAQVHADPRQLTFEEGKRLLDQIAQLDHPLLVFSGGDPLMREDLFDLAAYAISIGLSVSMTPSATPKVTKEAMRKAKEVGLSRWAFSLDGSTAEIHDAFRGVPGSYDLTIRSIDYLRELQMPLQINTTVTRYNLNDLEKIAALLAEKGVVLWSLFFLVPTGRGQVKDMITAKETEEVFAWLYRKNKEVPFQIKTTEAHHYRRFYLQRQEKEKGEAHYEDFIAQKEGGIQDLLGRAPQGVRDGNGFVFISHIGDVYPSGFLPIKAGNVRETPLPEIYRKSPLFQSLRNPSGFKGKCGVCEYNQICGGSRARAYGVTGDYLASEPTCIYIPQALRTAKG